MKPFTLNREVEEAWKRVEEAGDALRTAQNREEYLVLLRRLETARDEYLRVRKENP